MNKLRLGGRACRPLVQGGMGVGLSAHRLAGAVAREDCVGTVSSVDLRRLHPDLMRATAKGRDKAAIEAANLEALARDQRLVFFAGLGRSLRSPGRPTPSAAAVPAAGAAWVACQLAPAVCSISVNSHFTESSP